MPRPHALTRALAAAALGLAPACLAAVAAADPIISSQDKPDSPDSPTNNGVKADSDDAGAAAASASGAKPAAGVFPENDGALHTSVQANDPMTPAKEAKPIIPAGN